MTTSEYPLSVFSAARTDDYLKTLIAMRDKLATSIDECESMRDLSSLNKQLADVLKQIDELKPAEQVGDVVDEIAQRRSARRASAAKAAGSSKRSG